MPRTEAKNRTRCYYLYIVNVSETMEKLISYQTPPSEVIIW